MISLTKIMLGFSRMLTLLIVNPKSLPLPNEFVSHFQQLLVCCKQSKMSFNLQHFGSLIKYGSRLGTKQYRLKVLRFYFLLNKKQVRH